jgi:choline-glycine betaine transporter
MSSDPGSLVIVTIAEGGKMVAQLSQRVQWRTFEGLLAIALLHCGRLKHERHKISVPK